MWEQQIARHTSNETWLKPYSLQKLCQATQLTYVVGCLVGCRHVILLDMHGI